MIWLLPIAVTIAGYIAGSIWAADIKRRRRGTERLVADLKKEPEE